MEKVIILMGATGVGKSETSIKLAKKFDMEIISADSVQIYKEFDIGSAKLKQEEMSNVKHYGIDLIEADKEFTVSDFVEFTKTKIDEISQKNKLPMIVGGTGLYAKSLVEGYNFGGTAKQTELRQELEAYYDNFGLEKLFERLQKLSPELAKKVDCKNKARVIRAIEIATYGGEKLSQKNDKYDFKIIALNMPRELLYERINKRCEKMLQQGLIEEVRKLYEKYGECQPMRAIGYKEVLPYLKGEITEEQMKELISQHTRNYAKRQLTFMRGMENIEYFDVTESGYYERIEESIKQWLIQ